MSSALLSMRGLAGGVLLTWVVACAPPHSTGTALDTVGLGATRAAFARAALQNDATLLASFYSDSALFLAPGAPTIRGRAAIEALFRKALVTTRFESFEWGPLASIGKSGTVSEVGWQHDVSRSDGHPAQAAFGRYLITWIRNTDGTWQMAVDATIVDSTRPAVIP